MVYENTARIVNYSKLYSLVCFVSKDNPRLQLRLFIVFRISLVETPVSELLNVGWLRWLPGLLTLSARSANPIARY